MKKQAQLYTKLKETNNLPFSRPTGSRARRISPLRWFGTHALRKRSPEVYGKALDTVIKVDDLIRKTVSNQNINLAEMKRFGKALSVNNFIVSANRFQISQKLINKAIEKIKTLFDEISKPYGTLDEAINAAIGKSPEKTWHTDKRDVDESDKYIAEKLDKISKMYLDLAKTARIFDGGFIGGRYWKSKTESGRNFSKNFRTLYLEFKKILDRNVETLKELDELRSIGDPSQYYKIAVKKIPNINTILNQPNVKSIWDEFSKSLNITEPEPDSKDTIKTDPKDATKEVIKSTTPASTSVITPVSTSDKLILPENWIADYNDNTIEISYDYTYNNIQLIIVENFHIMNKDKILDWIYTEGTYIIASINDFISNLDPNLNIKIKSFVYLNRKFTVYILTNLVEKTITGKTLDEIFSKIKNFNTPKTSHKIFINNLEKHANSGTSPKDLAIYMLRYANKIDGIDTEYASKLTTIAENILLK